MGTNWEGPGPPITESFLRLAPSFGLIGPQGLAHLLCVVFSPGASVGWEFSLTTSVPEAKPRIFGGFQKVSLAINNEKVDWSMYKEGQGMGMRDGAKLHVSKKAVFKYLLSLVLGTSLSSFYPRIGIAALFR